MAMGISGQIRGVYKLFNRSIMMILAVVYSLSSNFL